MVERTGVATVGECAFRADLFAFAFLHLYRLGAVTYTWDEGSDLGIVSCLQQTHDPFACLDDISQTRLPFSGIPVVISTRYHQTEDMDQRQWIAPKIPVQLSSTDYFANRDPLLEAVLEVIRAKK